MGSGATIMTNDPSQIGQYGTSMPDTYYFARAQGRCYQWKPNSVATSLKLQRQEMTQKGQQEGGIVYGMRTGCLCYHGRSMLCQSKGKAAIGPNHPPSIHATNRQNRHQSPLESAEGECAGIQAKAGAQEVCSDRPQGTGTYQSLLCPGER